MTFEEEITEKFKQLIENTEGEADIDFLKAIYPKVSEKEITVIYRLGRLRGKQQILKEIVA